MLKNSQPKSVNQFHCKIDNRKNVYKHGLGGFIGQIYGGSGDIRGYGPGNIHSKLISAYF